MINRWRGRLLKWWRRPPTAKERAAAALAGAIGFFWVGVLGRLLLGALPVGLGTLAWWGLTLAAAGFAAGLMFPKATTVVAFPLAMFGIGGNG